jgi:tRNA pseudouridine38-40 synthase
LRLGWDHPQLSARWGQLRDRAGRCFCISADRLGRFSTRRRGRLSILLEIAYDGTAFSGWAAQPGARTVAGEVLGAIHAVDPKVDDFRGASRTDAGVHARGQLALFTPHGRVPPKGWVLGLSAHLPSEIAVVRASCVPDGSDLPSSIIRKRYRYLVLRHGVRDPFWEGRAWRFSQPLDKGLARAEADGILGTHDFAAFRSSADERRTTIRTIEEVSFARPEATVPILSIDVVGNAFLHNMVRIIIGSLVDVARGRLPPGTLKKALASLRRADLGMTAPARGLYLERIDHALEVTDVWPPPAVGQ